MEEIEWRPIPGYEGHYEASSDGRIKRVFESRMGPKAGHIRSGTLHQNGYLELGLQRDGITKQFGVHRLVAMAFHGMPAAGEQARHMDGDSTNNRAANLRWGTTSDNTLDQVRHGTHHHARRTECRNGHPLTGTNLILRRDGSRACRTCKNEKQNARHAVRKSPTALIDREEL